MKHLVKLDLNAHQPAATREMPEAVLTKLS